MKGVKSLLLISVMLIAGMLSASTFDDVEKQILKKANIEELELLQTADIVVLEGRAASLKDKLEAEKIAADEIKTAIVSRIELPVTQRSDEEINVDIASRLRHKASRSGAFNSISVKTSAGDVLLSGSVRDAILFRQAQEAAEETPGVRSVENRIKILPPSASDDRLRLAIYRVLRSQYPYYFNGAYPRVSILVDFSRVKLSGYVHSDVDRVRMASIARQMPGVLNVENQLQLDRG